MAKQNLGKEFEEKFESDWKRTFPNDFIIRLKDNTSKYKNASKNPCDYVCHTNNKLYLVECKSCYGNTFNFLKLTQYDDLLSYSKCLDTNCVVIIWFIEHDKVLWVPIDTIRKMKEDNLKSININKLDSYSLIEVPSVKLRVYMKCDYSFINGGI